MRSRRKHDRFPKRLELDISYQGEQYRGISGNFSREGCFIKTKGSFAPDTIVHITLQLPEHRSSSLTGIIRWVTPTPASSPDNGIGIEIINEDDTYAGFAAELSMSNSQDSDLTTTTAEVKTPVSEPDRAERTAAPESVIIGCRNCGVKNRILKVRLPENPRCGKCRSLLNSYASSDSRQQESGSQMSGSHASESGRTRDFSNKAATVSQGKAAHFGELIAGRYQVQEIFGGEGKSAMGIVYKCFDFEHNRILALKTLQERFLDSKKIIDSFKKEALAWIHLGNHPYIVRAHWVRELDHKIFVACEFIVPDGGGRNSLTPFLKGNFSLKRALTWAIQICHGMEYACSRGVTPHRDIKPDNIMITIDGDVKITDFGLVGLWDKTEKSEEIKDLMKKNQEGLTFLSTHNNRVVAGSPPWMAPEQFYGVAETQSDIYSFGIILFQLISNGDLPFKPRKGETWRMAHKEYPVPRIPKQGEGIAHIINKCLQKRRDKRYSDFRELRKDLEDVFKKEITRKTGDLPPTAPELEELSEAELINKGMSMANLGLIEEGIKNYRQGIKLNPGNADAHYNLGNALAQKGSLAEAIREYREAVRIDRNMTAAHFNLGIALYRNGQLDEAITQYREAIRLDPELDAAYVNLGVALHKKGLTGQAMKAYREALTINPFFAEAYYKLGLAYLANNDIDETINAYKEALKINPAYVEVYNNLGSVYMKKGLIEEAIQAYRGAIDANTMYADPYYNLGLAYLKNKMHQEALTALEDFLSIAAKTDSRAAKAEETAEKLRKHLARTKR
ncbi:MAG: hypothetical protein C0402_11630 [Thermodesulfovibrio sp.]|nr:hypothetical protein [Thermodesulfovibrio sp.]